MRAFDYVAVTRVDDAVAALGQGSRCLAGGTNLLDLMKGGIEAPARIVDINRLPLAEVADASDGGLAIGALVRNSDLANHPRVRRDYPLLAQALLAGATPQLRNMASVGGNLLQRTRCYYFADTAFPACNKRNPGSGCGARQGHQRIHAILGASEACIAVHPSDMCVALAALDATVVVQSRRGERRIGMTRFHRLPGDTPWRDTELADDELITAVLLPPPRFRRHAHYLKLRDRASYAFALVSAAVALDVDGGTVRSARIAMGGVAHKPWRAIDAETRLTGQHADEAAFAAAARIALAGAVPLPGNAFKVDLGQRAVARALTLAMERA
ncbi:MAG TPA: xanthine dehydrogenase family protein subunit M [Casimicrobiaceae bacterium]|nr:xanthine dehydrogenase family protein subunit M [Casimicrobiaceae bacterium]